MKKKLFLFFCFLSAFCFSQTKGIFFGKIIDSTFVLKNANVINLTTKQGTFSNSDGFFEIPATENDSLQISTIGYKTKIIKVNSIHFLEKVNFIILKKDIIVLDEIVLKRHDLSGFLSLDIKKTPKDEKAELVAKIVTDIKEMDLKKIAEMPVGIDEIHLAKPATVRLPYTFEGLKLAFGADGAKKETSLLIKKLEEENKITESFLNELGDYFFFTELKIPKEKYYNFISYCYSRDIIELYKKNELLKIIRIFKEESVKYLETIKEE